MIRAVLILVPLLLSACTVTMRRTDIISSALPPGGVVFRFRGPVGSAFRARLMIGFLEKVKGRGHFLMTDGGRYRVRLTMEPLDIDYRPIFFVIPPLLSYLGCPQGTVTRRFSVAVFDGRRLIGIREGLVRRPFGLYYMIPFTQRRVQELVLRQAVAESASFFLR